MLVRVTPDGLVDWGDGAVRCALGRSGVRQDKHEGDGATPAGTFPMRRVLYRGDRLGPPPTGLPVAALAPDDGWCDDPADRLYNRPVSLPYKGRCERLWRRDRLYDVVVVIGRLCGHGRMHRVGTGRSAVPSCEMPGEYAGAGGPQIDREPQLRP